MKSQKFIQALALTAVATAASAQQFSATMYADSRRTSTTTLAAQAKLPGSSIIEAWTDIFGDAFGPQRAYGEAYLTKSITRGVAVDIEGDLSAAQGLEGTLRAGIQYTPSKSPVTVRYSPTATRHQGQQLTVFGGGAIKGRIGYGGFLDYDTKARKIITEWELSKRICDNLSAVLEARYNQYQKRSTGVAVGLRYTLR